jgi:hypothetical protein
MGGVSDTDEIAAAATGTFTCASCGGTWEKGWTEAEKEAERRSLFAELDDETDTVCEDCFRRLMGRVQVEAPELLAPGAPLVEGACYRTESGLPVHYAGCWCPK